MAGRSKDDRPPRERSLEYDDEDYKIQASIPPVPMSGGRFSDVEDEALGTQRLMLPIGWPFPSTSSRITLSSSMNVAHKEISLLGRGAMPRGRSTLPNA